VASGCQSSPTPKAAAPPFRPKIYAALGDSYAAGEGLPPFEADSGACHRSPLAYPRLVAAEEGSALSFAPCTGAALSDVLAPAGQLASVDPHADLVTVTVGGNDVGFVRVVADCLVGAEPCSHLDAQVEASLGRLGPSLEAGYGAIKARAPDARLLVVGYPQVVADPARADVDTCPVVATPLPDRRITGDDARWLREKGARLDEVVRGAAKAAGASYVEVAADFAGHEACAPDPWLTGVVLTDLKASFHPTAAGQAALARLVTRSLA
jgi:lysophospholipase L1-like esterase